VSVICAWCQRLLSDNVDAPVTHGLCPSCAADLEFLPQSLDRLLNTLPAPVLAVDGEGRMLAANKAAAALVRSDVPLIKGRLTGEVLLCVHADLPGGCGRTTHCSGCAIRRAFEHTAATGDPVRDATAFTHVHGIDGPTRIPFRVCTERLGPLVLLELHAGEPDGPLDRLTSRQGN
jgi:PAS domain-containing protein